MSFGVTNKRTIVLRNRSAVGGISAWNILPYCSLLWNVSEGPLVQLHSPCKETKEIGEINKQTIT